MLDGTASAASHLAAALDLAALGFRVFPVAPGTKQPARKGWQADATSDPAEVKRLWKAYPDAMVGLAAGKGADLTSPGKIFIDVDKKDGGHETLASLEAVLGELPKDVANDTPGGGFHAVLEWPVGVRIKSLVGAHGLGQGIDIRGCADNGDSKGFVVGPGSVRPDGGEYRWHGSSRPNLEVLGPPRIPLLWLFRLMFNARERQQLADAGVNGSADFGGADPSEWQKLATERLHSSWKAKIGVAAGVSLSTEGAGRVMRYVTRGIEAELLRIRGLVPGEQDAGRHALSIHSLLKGAAVVGADSAELQRLTAEARQGYIEAVCAMVLSRPKEPWTPEHAIERWDRNEEEAEARNLFKIAYKAENDLEPYTGDLPPDFGAPTPALLDAVVGTPKLFSSSAARWRGAEPEPADFVIDPYVPRGCVTVLGGAGGRGKSMMALQWMVCVAAGIPFLGHQVKPGVDMLHRRVRAICKKLGVDFDAVADRLFPLSYTESDMTLWTATKGAAGTFTPMLAAIERECRAQPELKLLIVDGSAIAFAGSEIDRTQVTAFMSALSRFAARLNIAIVLLVHQSKSNGDDDVNILSGSTAWVNRSRSVVLIEQPRGQSPGPLTLTHRKLNDGVKALPVQVAIDGGAFVPLQAAPINLSALTLQKMRELLQKDTKLSASPNSTLFAANVLFKDDPNRAFTKAQYAQEIADLLRSGRLKIVCGNRGVQRYVLSETASEFALAEFDPGGTVLRLSH